MQLKQSIDLVPGNGTGGLGLGSTTWADTDGRMLGATYYLIDGDLYFTPTPYINGSSMPIGGSSFSNLENLVTIPDANYEGNDLLIASNDQGLLRIDQSVSLGGIYVPTTLTGSSGWIGVRHMQVAPRVAGGPDAVWGLRYDDVDSGTTVTVLVGELNGTAIQTTEILTFPAGISIFGLAISDYDLDGSLDFALPMNFGLAVYSQDLGQGPELLRRHIVQAVSGGCTSFLSTEFVGSNQQVVERLAYWFEKPGGAVAKLVIINGTSTEPILDIVALSGDPTVGTLPATISGGDIDGDGSDDLFLTMRGQAYGLMLSNQADPEGPTPTSHFGFGPGQYETLAFAPGQVSPGQTSEPPPYFGNIDFEPGADLAVMTRSDLDPSQGQVQVFTRFGLTGIPNGQPVESDLSAADLVSERTGYTSDFNGVPTLDLALTIPLEAVATNGRGFTHLEVSLLHQTAPPASFMTSTATQLLIHELQANSTQQWVRAVPRHPNGLPITGAAGPGEPAYWPEGDHVWVRFRFVKLPVPASSGDPYLNSSRVYVAAFLLNPFAPPAPGTAPETSHLAYLLGLPTAGVPIALLEMVEVTAGLPPAGGPNALVGYMITFETLPELDQPPFVYRYPALIESYPAINY